MSPPPDSEKAPARQAETFPEASTSEADGNRPASPRIERLACHVTKRSIAAAVA
jgi:hypothetical protein